VGRLFGTDGVRGVANRELTAEVAVDLAVSAAHVLGEAGVFADQRPVAVVGTDSRASGEFLEAAVVAGLASAGVDVHRIGILPTPGVAYLTAALEADIGVMISASHNPMPDNGIKFLARGGHKLDDAVEDAIERRLREPWDRPTGARVGRVGISDTARATYVRHLMSTVDTGLDGMRVVVDCANGAASAIAPEVFRACGADVIAINAAPNGININDACGSTHMESLFKAVVEHEAAAGFGFDGDADRCLGVDADGDLVDGDQILAILALGMHDDGRLVDDTVVGTVMSNLGFIQAMQAAGLDVLQTAVGDRYILEAMRARGFNLGGEQSGHVIMSDHATTGDGVLTALQLASRMAKTGQSLQDLAGAMTRLPQVLINVEGVDKTRTAVEPRLVEAVISAEQHLGENGRVLLRPSGTEPVVRVMVEATSRETAEGVASELATVVRETLTL